MSQQGRHCCATFSVNRVTSWPWVILCTRNSSKHTMLGAPFSGFRVDEECLLFLSSLNHLSQFIGSCTSILLPQSFPAFSQQIQSWIRENSPKTKSKVFLSLFPTDCISHGLTRVNRFEECLNYSFIKMLYLIIFH